MLKLQDNTSTSKLENKKKRHLTNRSEAISFSILVYLSNFSPKAFHVSPGSILIQMGDAFISCDFIAFQSSQLFHGSVAYTFTSNGSISLKNTLPNCLCSLWSYMLNRYMLPLTSHNSLNNFGFFCCCPGRGSFSPLLLNTDFSPKRESTNLVSSSSPRVWCLSHSLSFCLASKLSITTLHKITKT